jgi:hypothetical protein
MAIKYLKPLLELIDKTNIKAETDSVIEVKHFFSGAALYRNKTICASLSPVGLAFKLADDEAEILISSGKAQALRYFPKGHIKKGYALFVDPNLSKTALWKTYLLKAIEQI